MNSIAVFFALHRRLSWALVVAFSAATGLYVALTDLSGQEQQRLSLLQTEAQRTSIEIMSTTLNGNLMGSVTLLGLMDSDIKQEASNGLTSPNANVMATLSTVGAAFDAEGVFVVGADGFVKSSWDRLNKPSTGLDVRFRPYYKMALQGRANVYAAVSMARGDRALYFTAPVSPERVKSSVGIGAVVARTDLAQVDTLLRKRFDVAMLLSPQGVVFASSRSEWLGHIDGVPNSKELAAIRELKQFGKLFENQEPQTLPIRARSGLQTVDTQRHAVATAKVDWNDPSGEWTLVLMENLTHTVPWLPSVSKGALATLIMVLMGWMWLRLLRERHAQTRANAQLTAYAQAQDANVAYRAQLAQLSAHLQQCTSLSALAHVFFQESRDILGALQGVLYVSRPDTPDVLELAGSAGCAQPPSQRLAVDENLLGQCARDRRVRIIPTPPQGFWTLRSGLGSSQPTALLLAPMVMHGALIGALELAVLQTPDATTAARFEDVVSILASNLEILRRSLQLQQRADHATQPFGGST